MKITLQRNATDNDMIELVTYTKTGDKVNTILWGVLHIDVIQDNDAVGHLLEHG